MVVARDLLLPLPLLPALSDQVLLATVIVPTASVDKVSCRRKVVVALPLASVPQLWLTTLNVLGRLPGLELPLGVHRRSSDVNNDCSMLASENVIVTSVYWTEL